MAYWYCVLLEEYVKNPEHCEWIESELAHDAESAAQEFMEEHEDKDGHFGLNNSSDNERHVLVWDTAESEATVIVVEPFPTAGYYESVMDPDDVYEDYNVKPEEVKEPEYAQISQ